MDEIMDELSFEINGYKPLGMLNIILALATDGPSAWGIYTITQGEGGAGLLCLIGGIVCLAILIIRNLAMQSVPKVIAFTLLQILVGTLAVVFIALSIVYNILEAQDGTTTYHTSSSNANYTSGNTSKNTASGYDYTSGQEELARSYGFASAEEARLNGIDVKTML